MLHLIKHTSYKNLSGMGRPDIFIKLECNQFANSFKARGIIYYLQHITKTTRLITFTTGNHGIALAAIAHELGVKATIVSTESLSDYKRKIIESYGAIILLTDEINLDLAIEYTKDLAIKNDYVFVPLFDNNDLLEGYSKISEEIFDQFGKGLSLFFPIGCGSLLLANVAKSKQARYDNIIIGVEPEVFQRTTGLNHCEASASIADSLSINKIPLCNRGIFDYAAQIAAISEDGIRDAMKLIYNEFKLRVEPGGAITLAAALKSEKDARIKVAIITGKNISPKAFHAIIEGTKVQQSKNI
jgi:threonine dehydratase